MSKYQEFKEFNSWIRTHEDDHGALDDASAKAGFMAGWRHQAARIAQLEADNASLRNINTEQDKALAQLEAQVQALRDDADRFRAAERAINYGIRGAGHGRRFKLVEICPMHGDEKQVDLRAIADAARAAKG